MEQPLALLETPVVTSEGWYDVYQITKHDAVELVKSYSTNLITTVCEHSQYIAMLFETVLGINLQNVESVDFKQNFGQKALYLKSNGRPLSGKILSEDELNQLEFFVMECLAPNAI